MVLLSEFVSRNMWLQQNIVPCIARRIFKHWTTKEVPLIVIPKPCQGFEGPEWISNKEHLRLYRLSHFHLFGVPPWRLHSGKESACQCRRYKRLGFDLWIEKIPWRRKWQATPLFLLGKFHGQRSLVGYSPWGCKDSDPTKHAYMWHGNWRLFLPQISMYWNECWGSCKSSQWAVS